MIRSNTSSIQPMYHSGDGHSINRLSFLFLDMIDHQFMPCIPRINTKPIYCFDSVDKYKDFIIKPMRAIKTNLFAEQWDEEQRILASVLHGNTDQSTVIKNLASYKYSYSAKDILWEHNNILESIFILHYIDDIEIRKAVRAALNRIEAYHQLCRAIAYMNGGKFRGNTELEIELWNECARLVACVVINYNAQILSAMLERTTNSAEIDFILGLSPVAWEHLNFLGRFEFMYKGTIITIKDLIKDAKIRFR